MQLTNCWFSAMISLQSPRKRSLFTIEYSGAGETALVKSAGMVTLSADQTPVSPGLAVFMDLNGNFTQVPVQPYSYRVGTAISTTAIILNVRRGTRTRVPAVRYSWNKNNRQYQTCHGVE